MEISTVNIKKRHFILAKEGSWIVIGQVVTVSGSLVLVRVLTEYLDPSQYGQLTLGLTVAGLVNQVVMGGVVNGIGRFYSIAAQNQDLQSYLSASWHLLMYATVAVAFIGFVFFSGLLWLGYSKWMGLAAAALVLSVFSGYNSALSGIQNAARQRVIVAFHGGLDAWLKILLAVNVMLWMGFSCAAVVLGYICSSLVVTASQLFFLRRTIPLQQTHTPAPQAWIHRMWAYSWPFFTWGFFTWMQQVSDRWALQTFASTAEVGQYAVLFQLGYAPVALGTGMAMSFLGPILYQRSGDATDNVRNKNVDRLGWRMTRLTLMVALLCFAITFAIHEWFFRLLVAPEYRESSYLLPWVVLAGGIFSAGQMLALKLISDMQSVAMSVTKIVTALIGILLNVIGASVAGMHGVVGALVGFSCIYFFGMAMLARRLSLRGQK